MRVILIGQRGTGKTTFLRKLAKYFPDHDCVDLDSEIERTEGHSVASIFEQRGEKAFRLIERRVFNLILKRFLEFPNAVIALGAGFDFLLPEDFEVVYVRRDSDERPRVFFDRPHLDEALTARESYLHRALIRKKTYLKQSDRIWSLPEGAFFNSEEEKTLFSQEARNLGGFLTLCSDHFSIRDPRKLIQSYISQGIDGFELRDDLLNEEQIKLCLEEIPFEKRLFSFRASPSVQLDHSLANWTDWDVDLLDEPQFDPTILSLHSREKALSSDFERIDQLLEKAEYVKWAPEIDDLNEIREIHEWKNSKKNRVLFFPRTRVENIHKSDWSWYRLLHKDQFVNFWRDFEGSSFDQPILSQWYSFKPSNVSFAAVLGSPVKQSFSPSWHSPFFAKRSSSFFYINMTKKDCSQENLDFLFSLGLRYAAVTSPLKQSLFSLSTIEHDSRSKNFASLNTIVWNNRSNQWLSTNTDFQGFHPLVEDLPRDRVVIWGGGGTANIIKRLYPRAAHYSSRSGELRSGLSIDPEVLIWAAGPTAKAPEKLWNPKYVVDLCYTQDSMARDYAIEIGAKYRSGLKMFARQAMKQQAFWSRYGE